MSVKKIILALAFISPSAHAMPDPVTWLLHGVGGYIVARVIDRTPVESVAVASAIGAAKEISDLNFSVPDFLAWGVGALFYHYTKDMVRCEDQGIQVVYAKTLEDCANVQATW